MDGFESTTCLDSVFVLGCGVEKLIFIENFTEMFIIRGPKDRC